jgi:hypothetical protein
MAKLMLTSDQVAQLLIQCGAQGWTVVTMGSITVPESNRNAYAINVNDSPEKPSHRSIDVGLFQINTFWNPTHAVTDLLDPEYNTKVALQILAASGGPPKGYARWNTYVAGVHTPHLPEARAAAKRMGVKDV